MRGCAAQTASYLSRTMQRTAFATTRKEKTTRKERQIDVPVKLEFQIIDEFNSAYTLSDNSSSRPPS